MKKKWLIIIIVSGAILLFGGYFFFLRPNLIISVKSPSKISLDGEIVAEGTQAKTRTFFGEHTIKASKNNSNEETIKIITVDLLPKEIEINFSTLPEDKKIEGGDLTPELISPEVQDSRIYYLGGRDKSYLIRFSIDTQKRELISDNKVRGANNASWSPNKKFVVLFLDREAYIDQHFEEDSTNVWLYDIEKKEFTPLNFDKAAFTDNENIIGIKDKQVSSYNIRSKQYEEKGYTVPGADSDIVTSNNVLILWNTQSIQVYTSSQSFQIEEKEIFNVALSPNGAYLSYGTSSSNSGAFVICNTKTEEKTYWALNTQVSLWQSNNTLVVSASDNSIWKIMTENQIARKIFPAVDWTYGEIFSDENNVYFRGDGYLHILKIK